jgi:hypothetical protein
MPAIVMPAFANDLNPAIDAPVVVRKKRSQVQVQDFPDGDRLIS